MKKCKEIMTKNIVTCSPDQTVDHVAELMKNENIGPVPIVDSSKRLLGIVTDRDIVVKVVAEHLDGRATRVSEIMSGTPVTCSPEDGIDDAMEKMSKHQIRRIPIVNERQEILGIISQGDLATRISKEKEVGEVVKEISEPVGAH